MKSIWYCRERRTPAIVQITFEAVWKNITVIYEGEQVGVLADRSELEAGQRYTAKDGSVLTIKLPHTSGFPEVCLNGKKLLLSAGDPGKVARIAFGLIVFVGIVNTIVGTMALISDPELTKGVWGNVDNLIAGVIFLVLSVFVWRGSVIGLATAVVLYAAGCAWWLYSSNVAGVPISTGQVVVRGLMFLFLLWILNVLWQTTPKRSKQDMTETPGPVS
jgi:hypothetical protein